MTTEVVALSVERRFLSELTDLPKDVQRRVTRLVDAMREAPPQDIKALVGHPGIFRARAGDYRVLFARGDRWVHVYSVQHRRAVYVNPIALPSGTPAGPTESFPFLNDGEAAPGQDAFNRSQLERLGLADVQIEALSEWDGSSEGLERLVDLDLPDFLLDPLVDRVSRVRSTSPQTVERDVQLIRRDVIDSFFGPLLRGLRTDHKIEELTIVSPWITAWDSPRSSFAGVCTFIRRRAIPTYVVTRPPEMKNHAEALDALRRLPTVELNFIDNLHAKYYLCDLAPYPVSLLASANSTRGSFGNQEVGVLVRGRGELETYVRDLQALTTELRATGARDQTGQEKRRPSR